MARRRKSTQPEVVLNSGWRNVVREASQPARERVAERIAGTARATAPVDTGAYRDQIRAVTDSHTGNVAVVARDHKSHWIEHGTQRMKPRRIVGRAAEANGFTPTARPR